MMTLPSSPLLKIMGWVLDESGRLVGIVVDVGEESWRYRPFLPVDHLALPVPTVKLVTTLRRYLVPPDLEGGPEQS